MDDRNPNQLAILSLLERTFADEASPADYAELARWLAEDPARQALVDTLRAEWGRVPEAHDVNVAWARMAPRLQPTAPTARPFGQDLAAGRRRPWTLVAAAAAAAVLAGIAFRLGGLPTTPSTPSHPPAPRVYATASGQRAELRLPDGTHVVVAPETRVRVAADFGKERRDVYLDGEAYFEVAHDSARPFTVFAGNASTRDVGTAFAVRSYSSDGGVRVVVGEGKVAMSGAGLLAAGDVGRLSATGDASVRHHANVAALLGWTRGELAFEDAPLADVLRDLGRWYGVTVELGDSTLAPLPFTGSLRGAAPMEAVQLVAGSLGLRVQRVGSRTVLVRR